MGWLKKIFKIGEDSEENQDEISHEQVEIDKLQAWVEQQADAKFQEIIPEIEQKFSILLEEKRKLLTNLENLNTAELHNPNVTEREKQIMEGNRAAYISQHKQFINNIQFSDTPGCKETVLFCRNFEELLLKLAKSTAKGHAVMNEFFADHASRINRTIKEMGSTVANIQQMLDEANVGIEDMEKIHNTVSELKSKQKLMAELDNEQKLLSQKLSNSEQLKKKLLKELEQIKGTQDYSEYDNAKNQREQLKNQLKQTESEISNMFSQLDKAMRKFERMLAENTELFSRYIENPAEALEHDENITIIMLLAKMRNALDAEEIDLKNKEKTTDRLSELTKDRLAELRYKYISTKRELKKIEAQVRASRVLEDIDNIQYKMEHTESQINLLQSKMEQNKKTISKIDLSTLEEEAKQEIKDVFMIEVDVLWQKPEA